MAPPNKKLLKLPLLIVLILTFGISLHFCLWKSGMFIDEIYSYGLSNSHFMPFIGNGEHDQIEEQILTRADFQDYLTVTDTEPAFDAASVYYNQVLDVHPPLYYWLLNFSSSLARGHFSKWIGLIPGLIIYLGMITLLYLLGVELYGNRLVAALTAVLYALSQVGLSTMLMIRMYVLMSFLTVLLAYFAAKELRLPALKHECCIGFTIFAGLMTQYYFVFYAFFLCLAVISFQLIQKQWKAAFRFSVCALAGVVLMLVCFPAVFTQMTGHRLGPESDALANLLNVAAWSRRLRYYFGQFRVGLFSAIIVSITGVCFWLGYSAIHRELRLSGMDLRFLVLLIPVIPTVCIPAIISPVLEGRYIYNIMPIAVLFAGFCLSVCSRHMDLRIPFVTVLLFSVIVSVYTVPDYIYEEQKAYTDAVSPHSQAPCVYLTGYYAGVTQDMLQLMLFDDVLITDDPSSPALAEYLEHSDSDEVVVYIDIDSMWGSGFDAKTMLSSLEDHAGLEQAEHLYHYALSDTYLMRR